jgi:hypothetical protein
MLSDLSFDNNVEAGGWRGYAQKVAKDAFLPVARRTPACASTHAFGA